MFEAQYFRLYKDFRGKFPALSASSATQLLTGQPHPIEATQPLEFEEAFPKRRRREGQVLADFIFGEPGLLISELVKETLDAFATTPFQLVPAVFNDVLGVAQTGWWYLHVSHTNDLLDMTTSVRLPLPSGALATLDEIKFNTQTLCAVNEQDRWMIKSWDIANGGPFFHARVLTALLESGATGFQHRSVERYRHGIESQERE